MRKKCVINAVPCGRSYGYPIFAFLPKKTKKKFFNFLCQPGLEPTSTKRLLLPRRSLVKLTHSLKLLNISILPLRFFLSMGLTD